MGYIDDKARETDSTIKAVLIIIFVVIWIIALVVEWDDPTVRIPFILAGLLIGGSIVVALVIKNIRKEEAKVQQQAFISALDQKIEAEYQVAKKRYDVRMSELSFVKKDQLVIWRKYSDSDTFYKKYAWAEGGKLWEIVAEPNSGNYTDSFYENPESIKKIYSEIASINYISIEGKYCVVYLNWKPIEYSKDSIEVFRTLVPGKIK